jgi:hypothetical protein
VQRREFLWRERVKLELQVQASLSRAESLDQAWCALQHQKPKLAAQIVLSGLARTRYLPAERLFHYEGERILQEEERLLQAIIFSSNAKQRHAKEAVACFALSPDLPLSIMPPRWLPLTHTSRPPVQHITSGNPHILKGESVPFFW